MTKDDYMLIYIRTFLSLHGYPPTVRQVAAHAQVSVSTAQAAIKRLEGAGRLVVERRNNRTLKMEAR